MRAAVQVVLVMALSSLVAAAEIASRFRDEPAKVLRSPAALLYLTANAAVSLGVLALALALDWRLGLPDNAPERTVDLTRTLAAGVAAPALLRTSLFSVKVGDREVGVGPSAAVSAVLHAVTRAIDRRRGRERLALDLLAGLSFERDYSALVTLCATAMQTLDTAEADRLGTLVAELEERQELSDADRLDRLGFALLDLTGERTLQTAAERIRRRRIRDLQHASLVDGLQESRSENQLTAGKHSQVGPLPASGVAVVQQAARLLDLVQGAPPHSGLATSDATRVDLQLLIACDLQWISLELTAVAYEQVDLCDARLLLGAPTVLGPDKEVAGRRLVRLLTAPVRPPYRPVQRGRAPGEARRVPQPSPGRPAWVVAATLRELSRLVDDALARATLDASLDLLDEWDARVARAATHLAAGDPEASAADLRQALRMRQAVGPVAVARDDWESVLRLAGALLEPHVTAETQRALWQAAAAALDAAGGRLRRPPVETAPLHRGPSGGGLASAGQLALLLRTVAQTMPPRLPSGPLTSGAFEVVDARPEQAAATVPSTLLTQLVSRFDPAGLVLPPPDSNALRSALKAAHEPEQPI